MKPPRTFMSEMMDVSWFRNDLNRRCAFGVAIVILGILTLFPRHYLAESELLWEDTNGGGLSAILGRAAGGGISLGALIGSHESIEADLTIARSEAVVREVVDKLHLVGTHGFSNEAQAEVGVRHSVTIAAMRGSILQIKARADSRDYAHALVSAYTNAIDTRLKMLAMAQADQKAIVTKTQLADTVTKLSQAQSALTRFRIQNHLAAPEVELGATVGQLATLQGELDAKQAELATIQKFETRDNIQYISVSTEIQSLEAQIAGAKNREGPGNGAVSGMQGISSVLTQYENLYRDDRYFQSLFEIYTQYLQGVIIDRMSANANMDVVEPPYVHPGRQINVMFLVLLAGTIIAALISEYYVLAPPIGSPRKAISA